METAVADSAKCAHVGYLLERQVTLHTAISQLPVIDGWSDVGTRVSIARGFRTNCHVMMGDFIN
jgi:hypothetical protein